MTNRIFLYIGIYTRSASAPNLVGGRGIYVYEFDSSTGQISYLSETQDIDNPSYLAIDGNSKHLYAVSEVPIGAVVAYAINQDTGELTVINRQLTLGSSPCHLSLSKDNTHLLAVNYVSGKSALLFPLQADGSIAPASSTIVHQGSGLVAERQDRPHAHYIAADPTNQYVFVADLGIDKLMGYQLDLANHQLLLNDGLNVRLVPGSGPRHFVFHPNNHFIYVIQELDSTVSVLSYDSHHGTMEIVQTLSALPVGYSTESYCSAIHLSPDGRFLYGSNRGHDSIVIYAVNNQTGELTMVGHQSTNGNFPRDFVIDPTSNFLLVANQHSDNIVSFRIDQQTGLLEATGHITNVPTPVCLKMISI